MRGAVTIAFSVIGSIFATMIATIVSAGVAEAAPIRCDNLSTTELSIDGLLDDWPKQVHRHVGSPPDAAIDLRCSWDGSALAIALDITDDRVVRVRGTGHEDHVDITVSAGGGAAPIAIRVLPGTAIARAKITAPGRTKVADSLQPHGFSIELRIPASSIPNLSPSSPALDLHVTFHDADLAQGGKDSDLELAESIELGDRKDLLDDFLHTVRLKKSDLRVDTMAELDPDRRGKERLVAGGTVIGVITDQFAFVSLPAAKPSDVKSVELVPLGPRGQQIIAAVIKQFGNGGSRDMLMLWTVWSGQLSPLAQIEIKKEMGANKLESSWRVVKGSKGSELWVEPKPAIGFTPETFNEEPAPDADSIIPPWDKRGGIAYALTGADVRRRDLPKKRR